jgi:hypothetical protein
VQGLDLPQGSFSFIPVLTFLGLSCFRPDGLEPSGFLFVDKFLKLLFVF